MRLLLLSLLIPVVLFTSVGFVLFITLRQPAQPQVATQPRARSELAKVKPTLPSAVNAPALPPPVPAENRTRRAAVREEEEEADPVIPQRNEAALGQEQVAQLPKKPAEPQNDELWLSDEEAHEEIRNYIKRHMKDIAKTLSEKKWHPPIAAETIPKKEGEKPIRGKLFRLNGSYRTVNVANFKEENQVIDLHFLLRKDAVIDFEKMTGGSGGYSTVKKFKLLEELSKAAPIRRAALPASGLYLSDLPEFDVKVYRAFGKNGDLGYMAGNPISSRIMVNGEECPNGLSLHSLSNDYSAVKYKLGGRYSTFLASVALNDSAGTPGGPPGIGMIATPLTFQVWGDGKLLWGSKSIDTARSVQGCKVDVTGVDVLELRVECPGDYTNAQAVWVEPRVLQKQ
jgi:hypothetical protein